MKSSMLDEIFLLLIRQNKGMTSREIADGINKGVRVVRNRLTQLVVRGWLKREQSTSDRREYLYSLSDVAKKRIVLVE